MRLTALLAMVLVAAACSGGSSASSSGGGATSGPPVATTLPGSGTVRLSDGKTYTVAAPGQTLQLDNLGLKIRSLSWQKNVSVKYKPPGTSTYAVFTVTMENRGDQAETVQPTQIWLRSTVNHAYLAADADVPRPLIGKQLQPASKATGTLVFPLPGKLDGGLLVYRFGDTPAGAKHVGIARY
jgi:uncharacterized protein DUF4352